MSETTEPTKTDRTNVTIAVPHEESPLNRETLEGYVITLVNDPSREYSVYHLLAQYEHGVEMPILSTPNMGTIYSTSLTFNGEHTYRIDISEDFGTALHWLFIHYPMDYKEVSQSLEMGGYGKLPRHEVWILQNVWYLFLDGQMPWEFDELIRQYVESTDHVEDTMGWGDEH